VNTLTNAPWIEGRWQKGLAAAGEWLRAHGSLVRRLQWVVVAVYAVLLVVPALLPLPDNASRVWNSFTIVAEFAFWVSGGPSCC